MRVVGAGFGRTGTKSLKLALERLGFGPCHHMQEVGTNPDQLALWQRVARGERPDWSAVFRDYGACVDWPSARFWRELAAHFPDAKMILSLRDPDAWFDSVQRTIYPVMRDHVEHADPERRERMAMAYELIVRQTFDERMDDRAHATQVFRDHNAAVRREIDPDRLLVFEASDGWEPLCRHLGVAVPDEPFPLTNTTDEFTNRHRKQS